MSTDDEMTIDERYKYLRRMQPRYDKADRRERSRLLHEMEQVTGLHRKSLIRLLRGALKRRPRRQQRGRTYGPEVAQVLGVISESWDHLCAERLQPNLVWMARHLITHGELRVCEAVLWQLGQISVSSVRRLLQSQPQVRRRLPRPAPQPRHPQRQQAPMTRIPWQTREPGHFEMDLVHHSGPSAAGDYLHTLQMVDVATGWSERIALLGRSYRMMQAGLTCLLGRLPFRVQEIHPDNGSEFFNDHLQRFWQEIAPQVFHSRSHPYRKNDNRFVEQKNASLVRAFLGVERLDSVVQMAHLNQLYGQLWWYYNAFQPVMRLCEKQVASDDQGRRHYRRRFDRAQTPLDRLIAAQGLPAVRQAQLLRLRDQTNPRQLRERIYDSLEVLFTLPGAQPGQTEDIFAALKLLKKGAAPGHLII